MYTWPKCQPIPHKVCAFEHQARKTFPYLNHIARSKHIRICEDITKAKGPLQVPVEDADPLKLYPFLQGGQALNWHGRKLHDTIIAMMLLNVAQSLARLVGDDNILPRHILAEKHASNGHGSILKVPGTLFKQAS